MDTTTPKSKRTALKPAGVAKPSIEKAENKKASKKSALAIVNEVSEPEKTVATEPTTAASSKKRKNVKAKVIRDSFSFPEQDYEKISELKKTCLVAGIHVKKNEILRAGLHLLSELSLTDLKRAVGQVEKIKTGRPTAS